MDIQFYDTYLVLPWYSGLPIILTGILLIVLFLLQQRGLRTMYLPTVCVALLLLVSLSQWVSIGAFVRTIIPEDSALNTSPDEPRIVYTLLRHADNLVILCQALVVVFVITLSRRMLRLIQ